MKRRKRRKRIEREGNRKEGIEELEKEMKMEEEKYNGEQEMTKGGGERN
jgi:hypothetical protein